MSKIRACELILAEVSYTPISPNKLYSRLERKNIPPSITWRAMWKLIDDRLIKLTPDLKILKAKYE